MADSEFKDSFLGTVSLKDHWNLFDRLITEVNKVRQQLGQHAYLIDEYLASLIEASNWTLAYEAGSDGFDHQEELLEMCRNVVLEKEVKTDHPFFTKVKTYIELHPFAEIKPQIRISLYVILLSKEFFEYRLQAYYTGKEAKLNENAAALSAQRERIDTILCSHEPLQKVNDLFFQSFVVVTPLTCFMQGFLNELMYELNAKDRQSSIILIRSLLDYMN